MKKKLLGTNAEIEKLKDQLDVFKYDKHCPMRWIIISGICYYFSTKSETASWDEAQKICQNKQKSASLAMPKSQAEVDALNRKANFTFVSPIHPDIWIGGTDKQEEGVWRWVDGTLIAE